MTDTDTEVVRLSQTRGSTVALAFFALLTSLPMAGLAFLGIKFATYGGPSLAPACLIGLIGMGGVATAIWIVATRLSHPNTSNFIEISSTTFRYVSEDRETSAPWDQVGPPEKYRAGFGEYSHMAIRLKVLDQTLSLNPANFNVSVSALIDLLEKARSGLQFENQMYFDTHRRTRNINQLCCILGAIFITIIIIN